MCVCVRVLTGICMKVYEGNIEMIIVMYEKVMMLKVCRCSGILQVCVCVYVARKMCKFMCAQDYF